jgi:hypothetical protein
MFDIHVHLFEAAFVEQNMQAFARGQATFGVLRINALLPAAQLGLFAALFHFGDICGHGSPKTLCDRSES